MKNCSRATNRLPCATILDVSAHAARNVISERPTLASGAHRRPPKTPSVNAPSSGVPKRMTNSMLLVLLEGFEVLQIQAVELFANLEKEHTENQHRHQHIERNPQLNNHRHTISGAHRAKEQPILHRQ